MIKTSRELREMMNPETHIKPTKYFLIKEEIWNEELETTYQQMIKQHQKQKNLEEEMITKLKKEQHI